jgi:hypothetical protein
MMKMTRIPAVRFGILVAAVMMAALTLAVKVSWSSDDSRPSDDQVVRTAQRDANSHQAAALSDGVVTWDEHESAIASVAQCARAGGLNVEVAPPNGRKPSSVGFTVASLYQGPAAERVLAAWSA